MDVDRKQFKVGLTKHGMLLLHVAVKTKSIGRTWTNENGDRARMGRARGTLEGRTRSNGQASLSLVRASYYIRKKLCKFGGVRFVGQVQPAPTTSHMLIFTRSEGNSTRIRRLT